ncbi:MAG: hypothetical protein KTV77_03735 [Wolbachia endosymbiont of Fragariocoptes setiger]|nr:hypothetical protein [Wolbachia endosymbiont of Fragariocoptes setiger]
MLKTYITSRHQKTQLRALESISDKVQGCYNKAINNLKNNSNQLDDLSYKQDDLFIERGIKYCINSVVQCFKRKEESKLC